MQMPRSLALIVLTARASVSPLCARGSLSFQRATPPLAPSRFLPPRELADDSMSLVASDAEELSGSVTDPAPSGLPAPSAAKAGMDAEIFRVLSKVVEELGLEWSPPEEPSRSRLDEWFLPGRRQAPQPRPSPFFPEVHDEILALPLLCPPPYFRFIRPHYD